MMILGLHSPIVGRNHVRHVEERLDRLIVAHLFAPKYFLAQMHFVMPRQRAVARICDSVMISFQPFSGSQKIRGRVS